MTRRCPDLSVTAVPSRSKKESKPQENRVLFSYVGSHDPFRGDGTSSGDGPVLSLLKEERFSAVHLFYNNDEYLRRASDLLKALRTRGGEAEVRPSAPDPRHPASAQATAAGAGQAQVPVLRPGDDPASGHPSRDESSVHRGEALGAPSGTVPGQSKPQRVNRFGGARP